MDPTFETIDCACVIHGDVYDWQYVERLYNMLTRNLTPRVKLHVYTEADRPVPESMIKHELTEWTISRPGRSWWYKMQLFDMQHHAGPLLYFDLDTVIVDNIDWIWQLPSTYFWAVRDFKRLWQPNFTGINSSVMWWNTADYHWVWTNFAQQNFQDVIVHHRGDQDFISHTIPDAQRKTFDLEQIKSWRWQCVDGGYDFAKKRHVEPGTGTKIAPETSVLIFHGHPKPDKITDSAVVRHWQ